MPEPLPKILVVEDQQIFRQVAVQCLSSYQKVIAKNATQGLELFKQYHPDITFLDIILPDGNGWELLQAMRQHTPHAFVTIMTGTTDTENRTKAQTFGADGFMQKPFCQQSLETEIAHYREQQKSTNLVTPEHQYEQLCNKIKLIHQRMETRLLPQLKKLDANMYKEANELLNNLTTLSGNETHQPIDMNMLFERIKNYLETELNDLSITLKIPTLPIIQGHKQKTEIAFAALIHDALATQSDTVEVSYHENDAYFTFEITTSYLNQEQETGQSTQFSTAQQIVKWHGGWITQHIGGVRIHWPKII